jgi:hypothetical protein
MVYWYHPHLGQYSDAWYFMIRNYPSFYLDWVVDMSWERENQSVKQEGAISSSIAGPVVSFTSAFLRYKVCDLLDIMRFNARSS